MDQPCKVANPARGRLDREDKYFPVPVRAWEFGLVRHVRPSRPALSCSFPTLRLNLVLTHGIPPAFRDGVHLFIHSTAIGPVPILSGHDSVHCRESAGIGPVPGSPQGRSSNGCFLFRDHHGPINVHLLFPSLTIGMCVFYKNIGGNMRD